jgi:hypothetical protein
VIGLRPIIYSESKLGFLLRLLAYSFIYGTIFINWIDLFAGPAHVPGYHLWLTFIYFAPFITVSLIYGLGDWELTLGFGLFTSLMNDLLYYIIGRYLFGIPVDLAGWYRCQLLPVCDKPIYFDFLFLKVKPYPLLMPLSIYARVVVVYLLLRDWWRKAELKRVELKRKAEEWREFMLDNPPPTPAPGVSTLSAGRR